MISASDTLVDLVTTLTTLDADTARDALAQASPDTDHETAVSTLVNLVRQAPTAHDDRQRLLGVLPTITPTASTSALLAAADLVRRHPPRFPERAGPVELPPLDPVLTQTFEAVQSLDAIAQPWTLVGGLMVLLHCAEHHVPFTRATADADLAVGVFTHRRALRDLTRLLAGSGFVDVTPDPMAGPRLSYRWSRTPVLIDLLVPQKVNDQHTVPTTTNRRPAVELPGTQQALARTERVTIRLAGARPGQVRRPDLLGALSIKARAAVADRRDPGRHVGDLVALMDALVASGDVLRYAAQARPKDRAHLAAGTALVTDVAWRTSQDQQAARDALAFLLGTDA